MIRGEVEGEGARDDEGDDRVDLKRAGEARVGERRGEGGMPRRGGEVGDFATTGREVGLLGCCTLGAMQGS